MKDYYMKKDQEKALSVHSPSVHPTSDASATSTPSKFHVNRRHIIYLCGCCTGTTAILGFVILILYFTVLKVRDPTLALNSVKVDKFRFNTSMSQQNFISANVTLVSEISIKNPNMVSFNFDRTVTKFDYHEDTIGVAYAPAGRLGAQKATKLNVTMDVLADRIMEDSNVTANILFDGELGLTSYTSVKGRASVFGLCKKDMEVGLNCSIVLRISILTVEIKNAACLASA
jgi:Late embryogenesis abundant protein